LVVQAELICNKLNRMARIHFMKSGSNEKTLCGIKYLNVLEFTDKKKGVTCKKCLKSLNKIIKDENKNHK